jgi:DNA-binding MarR family transcriptional regulator
MTRTRHRTTERAGIYADDVVDLPDRLADDQIDTYVALMDVAGQLRFRVELHLREVARLSFVQFEILGRLMRARGQRLRMTDLADSIAVSRSGLTYQVAALADAGFVERSTSTDDERATLVVLTNAGRAEFLRVLPGHVEIVRTLLFDAVPDKDARSLGKALSGIRDHIRALPPRSAQARRTRSTGR